MKAGKWSPISQTAQKKGAKKAKAGKQQHGKGSSLEPPAPGERPPLKLSKSCCPAAGEVECHAPELSRKFPAD